MSNEKRMARLLTVSRPMAIALLAVAASGCSAEHQGGPWNGSVIDSAGVEVVHNPDEGLWKASQVWSLQEDLRFGAFAGDAELQFGQIGGIAVGPSGNLFVMDRQAREVRVFSATGEFLRAIGSPGNGPGEFGLGVSDVFVGPGDTVLIPDIRNQRIHRFLATGSLVGSTPLDPSRYRPLRYRWDPATRRAAVQLRPTGVMDDGGQSTLDEIRVLTASGEFGEILLTVPSGGLLVADAVRYFTPEPAWALTDSLTVIYGVNNEYRIGFYDHAGRLRRVISKATESRPITDRDIRALFAYLDRAWLEAGVPPSRLALNHQRVSFAEFFPAYYAFAVGYEGSLWVQPVQAPSDLTDEEIELYNFIEDFGARDWEVFDRVGRFLGVVEMPPRFQPRLFVEDVIYGVVRDQFDVQYVARLRVLP